MKPRILVVEDDDTLRFLTREALIMMEMDVVEASTADEAFSLLTLDSGFNLVVTDIRMPGIMDGLDLARLIWREWPDLPVVVTSGHRLMTEHQLPSLSAFLAKPWTLERFEKLITLRLKGTSGCVMAGPSSSPCEGEP